MMRKVLMGFVGLFTLAGVAAPALAHGNSGDYVVVSAPPPAYQQPAPAYGRDAYDRMQRERDERERCEREERARLERERLERERAERARIEAERRYYASRARQMRHEQHDRGRGWHHGR